MELVVLFAFHPWWNAGKETTIQHFPLYSHSFVKNELAKKAENSGKTVEKSWTKRMAKVWKLGFYHSMFISLFLCLQLKKHGKSLKTSQFFTCSNILNLICFIWKLRIFMQTSVFPIFHSLWVSSVCLMVGSLLNFFFFILSLCIRMSSHGLSWAVQRGTCKWGVVPEKNHGNSMENSQISL